MVDSVKTFQSHLTAVMDSLVRASVCEITKLFQDTVNDYLVEISLNRKENEALKLRLRLTENKLRNERKYGMGWAAGRRSSGLLVSDESGRKKRKTEMTRARQRNGTAFDKDWPSNPWEAGSTAPGETREAARDVFLVQLQGTEGEEEEEECAARTGEETTNIKEESTEMDGGYRPESLRLIHEALQMDVTEQSLEDVTPIPGVPSVGERAPVEQPHCQEDWGPQIVPPEAAENFNEQHRARHGVGVEELSGLETALKTERRNEHPAQKPDLPAPEHNAEDFDGQASESIASTLGDLEYVMAQKYIGLDGLCSSEQDSTLQPPQVLERDADGLLDLHVRLGPALPHPEARSFASTRLKEGLRSLPAGGGDVRCGWLKRGRDGEGGGLERLAMQPGKAEPSVASGHTSQGGEGGAVESGRDPGEFVHICNQCGSSFGSAADLDDHPCLLAVQSQQQHSCALCRKSFAQAGHLRTHMLLHAGEAGSGADRAQSCGQCGRTFAQAWGLKNHECSRSEERPHQCELCGKRFTHSRSLERHQLVHTGERPHRCPQCGRSFSRLGNLERHQRIHTGERPYGCATCGKRFSRVEYLRRHQQVHGADRPPHQCAHCGKSFADPEQLKGHQCFYGV